MKIQRLLRKKRAVSPILAAILLIGLAVAAGAVLFIVVLPLISEPGGSLVFDETATKLTNKTAKIALKNEKLSEAASITNITIIGPDRANFAFVAFSINAGSGKVKDYTFDEELSAGKYTITVTFDIGDATDQTISIDLTI
ncbi:MAG: archaellin/type IV pilin N-terminal domain-containing protein [Promethearchaeota archaeon]